MGITTASTFRPVPVRLLGYHRRHSPARSTASSKRPDTEPLVIHTQTASEYWDRRGSLVHTDSLGNDLPDYERARVFLFAGLQHNADPLGGPRRATTATRPTPLNTTPLLRALLDSWTTGQPQALSRPEAACPPAATRPPCPPTSPGPRFPSIRARNTLTRPTGCT